MSRNFAQRDDDGASENRPRCERPPTRASTANKTPNLFHYNKTGKLGQIVRLKFHKKSPSLQIRLYFVPIVTIIPIFIVFQLCFFFLV